MALSDFKSYIPGSGNFGSVDSSQEAISKLDDTLSEHYIVRITSSRYTGDNGICARCPETLSLTVNSEWKSAIGDSDASGSTIKVAIQEFFNRAPVTKEMTAQVWSGNSPIELTLPLEFRAGQNPSSNSKYSGSSDAYKDVVEPIKFLYKMCLPTVKPDGILLVPPGPRIFKKELKDGLYIGQDRGDGDTINIHVGSFLRFERVLITNVSAEFGGAMSPEGYPMTAKVDVTFRTLYSIIGSQVDSMLKRADISKKLASTINKNDSGGKSLLSYAMNSFRGNNQTV